MIMFLVNLVEMLWIWEYEYESLKNDFALVDVWRNLHPASREFTWFNSSHLLGVDWTSFWFLEICCHLALNVTSPLSDFRSWSRFSCFWHPHWDQTNNYLLKDKDFCTSIEKLIDCHLRFLPSFASLQDWWKFLKLFIKEEAIVFSHNKWKSLRKEQVFLTNKLIRLRRCLVDGDDTVSILISDTVSRLKALRVKEIEGIMICSCAQWLEEG